MAEITELSKMDNEAIAKLFCDYVSGMEDKPRHTVMADMEVGVFEQFCAGAFQNNYQLRNGLYDKMMNVAVEYEESGFIAGFRYAMALLSSQNPTLVADTQIPTSNDATMEHKAVTKPQATIQEDIFGNDCITTKQIADMFETTNFKVVARIEKYILPTLDNDSKKFFYKVDGFNVQHKPITMYKLNKAACQLYLKEMEPKKKNYINIAGGYAKLQELMESVFPSEVRALLV